ncbi:glycosyltransferase family 2 protein [Nonlabens sp. Asnod3-A02]|uniref:glycosyltransferase family 2 protein n=1 Tax=Nonlabens sp. Asnod3-A02 TaxID=3160579 RepID=UPI00386966F5
MDLSIVFLSRVSNDVSITMLVNAITSCIETTLDYKVEIIVVESGDLDKAQQIVENKATLIPYKFSEFNFHKALNIGLENANGRLICFSNNDVVFYKDWFEHIDLSITQYDLDLASPVDPKEDKLWMTNKENISFIEGYQIQKHFKGWCFVAHKRVFNVIKKFDEQFDFYFADNDFITQVEFSGFKHAAVLSSKVHHLAKDSTPYIKDAGLLLEKEKVNLHQVPSYVIKENRWWLVENKKMINGLLKYHKKWGTHKIIKGKKMISHYLIKWNLKRFSRILFLK